MLIKEKLRQLRSLNATSVMKRMAESNETKIKYKSRWGYESIKERKYAWYARCQQINGYLKVAIFLPCDIQKGIYTPMYELFINYDGNEYIARELDKNGNEVRWSKIMIDNMRLNGNHHYEYESYEMMYINPEGSRTIKSLLHTEQGGYEGIRQWQHKIRREKETKKIEKEVAPWEAEMKFVPELPKAFEKWWQKEVIRDNYIFYEYDKNVTEGYCTYCEKNVPVIKPRHNRKGSCTECGHEIIYKSVGKMANRIYSERYSFQIVQKMKEGFVVRHFTGRKQYAKANYKNPDYSKWETRRSVYENGQHRNYEWEDYKKRGMRWRLNQDRYIGYYNEKRVYTKNMEELSKSVLKNTGLPQMIKHVKTMNIERYLKKEKECPVIEQLVKIGLYDVAEDITTKEGIVDNTATELYKKLRIDKGRLTRLRKMKKPEIFNLIWLQHEKETNTKYADEMIEYFAESRLLMDSFKFLNGHMTYVQIWNYLKRQQSVSGESPAQIRVTWADYMNMSKKLKMNIDSEMIYKPKNLKEKHTEVMELLQSDGMQKQVKKIQKQFPKVNDVCKTLKKYEYKGEKYMISSPENIYDIVREGTILQHCVHTCDYYFDRIQRRETYLLFLRRVESPDTPYYTIEAEPNGNIRQKRTTGDNQNKDIEDAKKFLKEWQKEIKKRLTKEDMELARESDQLRRKGYEELRKKGNRVWHGKLAGKLLADVLEDDFMSAI